MTKKDDVTTYTKAELIKALRASVAREAKLQKRIVTLEGMRAAPPPLHPDGVEPGPYDAVHQLAAAMSAATRDEANELGPYDVHITHGPGPYDVVHITQGPDTVSELVPRDLFPWEKD